MPSTIFHKLLIVFILVNAIATFGAACVHFFNSLANRTSLRHVQNALAAASPFDLCSELLFGASGERQEETFGFALTVHRFL